MRATTLLQSSLFLPVRGALVASALLVAPARAALAQTVHGQVLEQGTERPVRGASVTILGEDQAPVGTALTDSSGVFLAALARAGTFTLGVRHPGHQPGISRPFALAKDDYYEPTLYLVVAVTPRTLAPVEIRERANRRSDFTRGFEERRARGFGEFLDRWQIARRGATTPVELLRGFIGVSFARDAGGNDVPVSTRGATGLGDPCRMAVYIDGSPLTAQPINYAVRPSDIEAIEVYASTAEMPAQFRHGDGGCGAIMIWSRTP